MALEASLGNPGIPKKLFIPLLFPLFGLSSLHVTDRSHLSLIPCLSHVYRNSNSACFPLWKPGLWFWLYGNPGWIQSQAHRMGWVHYASQMAAVNVVATQMTSLRLSPLSKWLQWAEVNGGLSNLSQLAIREAASPRPTAAILLFSPPSPAPEHNAGEGRTVAHDPSEFGSIKKV